MNCYKIQVRKNSDRKEILAICIEKEVKHIFTLNTDRNLGDTHVIEYHESETRIVSRLKARSNCSINLISVKEALYEAALATRTSIGTTIFKKLRYYIKDGELDD